ncbi:MAG: flagellar biosynthesis anti-sigma factor FlgM [Bdellovibrionales bacterium]
MKVGNKVGQSIQGSEAAKATKTDTAKRSGKSDDASSLAGLGSAKAGDTAKVSMSDRAQAMQKAKAIAGTDTVDEAKVARLQKLIDEGKYKVDSKAVADRMVNEHLAMSELDN